MTLTRHAARIVYGALALVALVGTWGQNVQYLHLGFLGANVRFWQDTLANPASRSITVDLLVFGLAVIVWMLLEARRLSIPGVWVYVVLSLLIAVSVMFPLFMIHRERILARRDGTALAGQLRSADVAGLAVLGLAIALYTVVALMR